MRPTRCPACSRSLRFPLQQPVVGKYRIADGSRLCPHCGAPVRPVPRRQVCRVPALSSTCNTAAAIFINTISKEDHEKNYRNDRTDSCFHTSCACRRICWRQGARSEGRCGQSQTHGRKGTPPYRPQYQGIRSQGASGRDNSLRRWSSYGERRIWMRRSWRSARPKVKHADWRFPFELLRTDRLQWPY